MPSRRSLGAALWSVLLDVGATEQVTGSVAEGGRGAWGEEAACGDARESHGSAVPSPTLRGQERPGLLGKMNFGSLGTGARNMRAPAAVGSRGRGPCRG